MYLLSLYLCYNNITNLIYDRIGMEALEAFSKSFSDINRLKIIALIDREKELCVCEISDTLSIAQPLVSRHLKQLRKAGIVQSRQEGKWMIYRIHSQPTKILQAYLEELKAFEKGLHEIVSCSKR